MHSGELPVPIAAVVGQRRASTPYHQFLMLQQRHPAMAESSAAVRHNRRLQ
jgi:hypothetical protein